LVGGFVGGGGLGVLGAKAGDIGGLGLRFRLAMQQLTEHGVA